MRHQTFIRACALASCVLWAGAFVSAFEPLGVSGQPAQDKPKQEEQAPKLSDAEAKAATKINEAKDPAAKLQAASEFIKKYPKSAIRARVAENVAGNLANAPEGEQRIKLAESYLATFTGPGESDYVAPFLLDAYINAAREADAMRVGETLLKKNPEDVDTLRRLSIIAGNAAIKGNNAFVAQGQQYGLKAIELMEADKKPAHIDAAKWAEYKATYLPALYRETGVLAMRAGDKTTAKTRMERAIALKSSDPVVYLLLSDFANEEYNTAAQQYQAMPAGAEKSARLKKIEAQLDQVIELYAQTVAITEGKAQYAEASKQIRQDLEGYYKYRHGGSTNGLQELIDKHKKTLAAP